MNLTNERFLEIALERQTCEFCVEGLENCGDCTEVDCADCPDHVDLEAICIGCKKAKGATHEELTAFWARIVELAKAKLETAYL